MNPFSKNYQSQLDLSDIKADTKMSEVRAKARNIALVKIAKRALWWFRWAALSTFLTGLMIMGITEGYFDKQIIGGVELWPRG